MTALTSRFESNNHVRSVVFFLGSALTVAAAVVGFRGVRNRDLNTLALAIGLSATGTLVGLLGFLF